MKNAPPGPLAAGRVDPDAIPGGAPKSRKPRATFKSAPAVDEAGAGETAPAGIRRSSD
jgi:hypothetical protein